ncbi:hypothetical protein B0H14DRAFT_2653828, partial [Mycena olivaceomarginata]
MPPSARQRCVDDEECHLRRLTTYRKYRKHSFILCIAVKTAKGFPYSFRHLAESRKRNQERMARVRAALTEEQREKHREALGAIGSSKSAGLLYCETIAHCARCAMVQKNAEAGCTTKPQPKARRRRGMVIPASTQGTVHMIYVPMRMPSPIARVGVNRQQQQLLHQLLLLTIACAC